MGSYSPEHLSFADRVLAEAVRQYEEDGRRPIDDPIAEMHAQSVEADLEPRIVVRARAAQISGKLRDGLRQVRGVIGWIVIAGALGAFLIGAATASATLRTAVNGTVNFYWVLGGVLGVQSIALVAWLAVMSAATLSAFHAGRHGHISRQSVGLVSLGAAMLAASRWIASRLAREAHQFAAIAASVRVNSSGALGRWTFSAITHGLWLAFNIGCIVGLFYLLATRHFTFVWETTILGPERYEALTRAIGYLPERTGFLTPGTEQIRNSQFPPPANATATAEEARHTWAGLLVGSLILYGFAPRLLLLAYSISRRRLECRRFRLDTTLPGYARLEPRLLPRMAEIGRVGSGVDASEMPAASTPGTRFKRSKRPISSSHAILGFEIERPTGTAWPPSIHGVVWDDLGLVEGGDEQQIVLKRLETSSVEPASLTIVCSLATTPDRGVERFIAEAQWCTAQPVVLVLTGGQTLRDRGYTATEVAQRVSDWRRLGQRIGLEGHQVMELDVEHMTASNRTRLKNALESALIGSDVPPEVPQRRIEQAFDLIVRESVQWESSHQAPSTESQAEMHRKIALLYRTEQSSWSNLFRAPSSLKGDVTAQLRESAHRVQALLPERLRRNPKWLAAGALSGALGCVAAATLVSPIAIGALPMWSAIGAAIAAAWQPHAQGREAKGSDAADFADAVRSAALFALVLELQGYEEATITRLLDQAIGPASDAAMSSIDEARAWLHGVHNRLELHLEESKDQRN